MVDFHCLKVATSRLVDDLSTMVQGFLLLQNNCLGALDLYKITASELLVGALSSLPLSQRSSLVHKHWLMSQFYWPRTVSVLIVVGLTLAWVQAFLSLNASGTRLPPSDRLRNQIASV